jgi:hypothetical protein
MVTNELRVILARVIQKFVNENASRINKVV